MLDLLTSDLRLAIQPLAAWIICLAALVWGGGPERAIALIWLLVFKLADAIYHAVFEQTYNLVEVDLFHAGNDVVAGLGFIVIALFANRNYTLGIAAMQLLAIIAHVSRGLVEEISPVSYAVMVFAPGWAQLFLLVIGLLRHLRRKRKHGAYRDWRVVQNLPAILRSLSGRGGSDKLQPSPETIPSWRDELK